MDPKIKSQKISSLSSKFVGQNQFSTNSLAKQAINPKKIFENNESQKSSIPLNRKAAEDLNKIPKNSLTTKTSDLIIPGPPSSIKKSMSDKGKTTLNPKIEFTDTKNSEIVCRSSHEINLEIVKRRLNALKVLQMKTALFESDLYEEIYLLECKYNAKIEPLRKLRYRIISGEQEPTDDECNLKSILLDKKGDASSKKFNELESEREINRDLIATGILNYSFNRDHFVKGIPDFWLNVLKNESIIGEIIEVHDEPILKYLTDIECHMKDTKPFNFKIDFHFAPNEYFTNATLSKTYELKVEIDSNDPYVFEAPEIDVINSCKINWKSEEKNVTKTKDGLMQTSFFHLFDTSDFENKEKCQLSRNENAELALDIEFGFIFKEKIIPKAALYYLGEIVDVEQDLESESDSDCEINDGEIKQ